MAIETLNNKLLGLTVKEKNILIVFTDKTTRVQQEIEVFDKMW